MIDGEDKARIEAAIRYFEAESVDEKQRSDIFAGAGDSSAAKAELRQAQTHHWFADLCRYFLTGEKDQKTWRDGDFGL